MNGRPRLTLVACAACVLGGGCAALQSPTALPTASTTWASQFAIRTNTPLEDDARIKAELIELREHVCRTLDLEASSAPIEIYIFDDRAGYERFLRAAHPELPPRRAFFVAHGARQVVYTFRGESLGEDLRHEATHALLHSVVPEIPLWLDEGLAEYFEAPASVGGRHAAHVRELAADGPDWSPRLARLERLQTATEMNRADYRAAWAFVHFLLHGPPDGRDVLTRYLRDLNPDKQPGGLGDRIATALGPPDRLVVEHVRQLARTPDPSDAPRADAACQPH